MMLFLELEPSYHLLEISKFLMDRYSISQELQVKIINYEMKRVLEPEINKNVSKIFENRIQ